jgi:CubicO group peptidase (beta-lactamase class C family)
VIPASSRPFDAGVLAALDAWGAARAGLAVVDRDGFVATRGAVAEPLPWASVTKLVTAYLALIAVERGEVSLDDPAGPPGATLRHLLAHAGGYAFDDATVIGPPGRTRSYSNAGFDVLAALVSERVGRPFAALLRERILDPLGMASARLVGRPSEGLAGSLEDLATFAFELLRPRLLPAAALERAATVAFPGLRGVLPGVGRFDPLDWGLGFELHDGKSPHWMATTASARTFGHFGGSGTFLWVDPDAGVALACLTDRAFGPWALEAWPAISDAVLAAVR